MIAVVENRAGRAGYVLAYSSGASETGEWEEVLVAHTDGRLGTYHLNDLAFKGLMSDYGLICKPEPEESM